MNVRNLDLLQAAPGEIEEDAWNRIKVIGTGTGLKDVEMLPPVAVPAAGWPGIIPNPTPPGTPMPGGLPFPPLAGVPGVPTPPPVGMPIPAGAPAPIANPFAGGLPQVHTVASPKNSALNHMAHLFDHGQVGSATPVKTLRISFENLSGSDVRSLLTKLSGVPSFDLELDKES